MNWDRIEGNWKQWTGKAKEQWGKLNDDTLTQMGGARDQLVGKIQESYGISKDEAERQVNDWSSSLDREQGGRDQGGGGQGGQGDARGGSMSQDWERTGRDAAARVGRWAGDARQSAEQSAEVLKTRIQEQPYTTIAVAAGIGFILGVLFSRK